MWLLNCVGYLLRQMEKMTGKNGYPSDPGIKKVTELKEVKSETFLFIKKLIRPTNQVTA